MPPKNPVRAARQAGRQAIRAAKDTRKVAKIESRVAGKVAKISGKSAPKPAAKSTPATSSKGNKKTPATTYRPSAPTVKLPATEKPKLKSIPDSRSKMKEMPAETRKTPTKKKGLSESEKNIIKMWKDKGYTYGKDGKVRDKNGKTPEENEAQRVKDMFLQPGETQANTSPFASPAQIKKREAIDAVKKTTDMINSKLFDRKEPAKKSNPAASDPDWKKNLYRGTSMKKKGGAIKKSMYTKRK